MRLLYTVGSPFARLVRIAVLEKGLGEQVILHELTREQLYSAGSEVARINPIGRVPTLLLDDGTVLSESKVILDYVDALGSGPRLILRDGAEGRRCFAEMGQAYGLLDSVTVWLRALRLPEPDRPVEAIAHEERRLERAADALERTIRAGGYCGPLDAAQVILGTALGTADIRLRVWKWRQDRSSLSDWYDTIAGRPSFQATEPPPG